MRPRRPKDDGHAATMQSVCARSADCTLWLNLAGSLVLAVDAFREEQLGFLLLEGVWALISAWGIVAKATGREAPGAH
jgi:hypothetical protein